jgi:hypothetical protein
MVFIRRGDTPGSTAFDGTDQRSWNTLKFVPPVPQLTAPANVTALFADGAYALADRSGHALFTGACAPPCNWQALAAPMASRGLGEWSVGLAGDSPQWIWRGKPVYVSQEGNPVMVPAGGTVLRP